MSNKTVCYGCNRRQVGCHSNCEEYLAEKEAIKKRKQRTRGRLFLKRTNY